MGWLTHLGNREDEDDTQESGRNMFTALACNAEKQLSAKGFMDTCIGGMQHRYEPRYDIVFPARLSGSDIADIHEEGTIASIEACKQKVYVHDVCVNCGKIINREVK